MSPWLPQPPTSRHRLCSVARRRRPALRTSETEFDPGVQAQAGDRRNP